MARRRRSRPLFVTLEGIDGSGKSTLLRRLAAKLRARGVRVKTTREETGTWLGAAVRRSIRERADPLATAFLFLADRAQHTAEIEAWLASRSVDVVLCDRYADSTIAYQAATLGPGVPRAVDRLGELHDDWALRPDVTFLLDLSPRDAMLRIRGRRTRIAYEKLAVLTKVRANYRRIARRERDRVLVLAATRPSAELADECVRRILAKR